MPQDNIVIYNSNEADEEININLQKVWQTIVSRKELLIKIFLCVLILFIILTFILPKKYVVSASLYINKSNNSNLIEVNPYVLNEASGSLLSMGKDKALSNEIELIKSELVLDKVIRENDLKFKKGPRKGEYISAGAFYGKGKQLKLKDIKNTSVLTIQYSAKNPEFAYNIVNSIINNYIELHKELNTEKSKYDKQLLQEEYNRVKASLEEKLKKTRGIPAQSMTGIGNLSTISAYSKSAAKAMSAVQGQYIAGERSQIEVTEESQKLEKLAEKLEWANLVDQLADSSKVIVINAPQKPLKSEQRSPKLKINIILGIVFGLIIDIIALIYLEIKDSKLSYSMLTDNIIFDGKQNLNKLKAEIISQNPKKILMISLTEIPQELNELKSFSNLELIYADLTEDFVKKIAETDKIMLVSKIQSTNADSYKQIRDIIKTQNKNIIFDVLV